MKHRESPNPPSLDAAALLASLGRVAADASGIAAVYLFGSAARERTTPLSDVDIALLFEESCEAGDRRRLATALVNELVRAHPGATFDVRDLDDLPLVVQGRVLTEGRLARSNDDARRVAFEVAVRQRYFDFLPFHQEDVREGLRSLRRRHTGG